MTSLRATGPVLALVAACLIGGGAAAPGGLAAPAPRDTSASLANGVRDPAILWSFDAGG